MQLGWGKLLFATVSLLLADDVRGFAQLAINPTTTLSAESANNTSAADGFVASSNGNLGAGNVSKINLHTLLYANSTIGIYLHWIPWHGESGYLDVGYDSADPTEINRQADDWISRQTYRVVATR